MRSDLPKKVRKLALRTALSAKAAEGKLIVVETATLGRAQDRPAQDATSASSAVSIGAGDRRRRGRRPTSPRAAANIAHVDVLPQQGANVYDILRRDTLVLTKDAVKHLEERLQ